MSDFFTYKYNVSIGNNPTTGIYKTHHHISQSLEYFNDLLTRIFGDDNWTWAYTYNECIIRFSKEANCWDNILWNIIVIWLLENAQKIDKILVTYFKWIEDCRTSLNMWNNNKKSISSFKEWWDPGEIISTKA